MADIQTSTWSETAASNNSATPDGWPEGQNYATVNDCAREGMAAVKREWNRSHYTQSTGGSSTVMTLTYGAAPPAYALGIEFKFKVTTSCGANPTMNVNSLGAKKMFFVNNGIARQATTGDLVAGDVFNAFYDTTLDSAAGALVLQNASGAGGTVRLGSTALAGVQTSAGIIIPAGYRSLNIGVSPTIGGAAAAEIMALQVMINGSWMTSTAGVYTLQQTVWTNAGGFAGTVMTDSPGGLTIAQVHNAGTAATRLVLELEDVRAAVRNNVGLGNSLFWNGSNWVNYNIFALFSTPASQRIEQVRVASSGSAFATGYLHVEGVPA